MEIVKIRAGDLLEVRVSGRLDNHWSLPFDEALGEILREGAHHLRIDLSNVNYLSSAAIGVLVKAHQAAAKLQGSFRITAASERVRFVLQLVKLETLLFAEAPAPAAATAADLPRQISSEFAAVECYALGGSKSECQLLGNPATLAQGAYRETVGIEAHTDVFALGMGALGHSYDECRHLFGEFTAAAGNAAFMPTDETSTPDYMTSSGELVPEIQALYGIVFRGSPGFLLRFESATPEGAVALSEIVRASAEAANATEFGIVMMAEVSGLVCAALRRSPVDADAARFDFPAIRSWFSFAPEHEHARTSSLVVGIAMKSPGEALPFVRPLSGEFKGHFHAAVTAFRSLPRGRLDMAEVIAQAFQPRCVMSVVHLLRDDREIEGAGESEFQRGACWVFPLKSLRNGESS